MNARPQADGLPESATGFCGYLVTKLFAYWGANAALVVQKASRESKPSAMPVLEAVGASGWLAEPAALSRALALASDEYDTVLSQRGQLLFSGFVNRLKPEFIELFEGRCRSGFWVACQVPASPGGLFVAFENELDTDAIEQVRLTFPILRASLKMFIHADAKSNTGKSPALSPRQHSILNLIVEGLTYGQVAKTLFISESTVKQEAKRIFDELGVTKRLEAIRWVQRQGQ